MNSETTLYDEIGHGYRTTRAADRRIVQKLLELARVPAESVICDVGAGSGNYANALAAHDYSVLAVDPSEVMRTQAELCKDVRWFDGVAERLPLPDNCAAATICIFAAHHFSNLLDAVREMDRICPKGPLIFFTFDPRESEPFWLSSYFPGIIETGHTIFPPLANIVKQVEDATHRCAEMHTFALPSDLVDQFLHAPWNQPETYLDAEFRANNSGFAKADAEAVDHGLLRLRTDLQSGAWDAQYGHLRHRTKFDAGYRFLVFRKSRL